ncbi:Hypothetical protein FKW44_021613 [Caligus rogercresseyi]|uniref:Uncharacterized protein n=1 Tax=Caligus rogercresseyi TaxID=217165 RepID=A0A7T8GS29_CALRO|nr:Hypothetical protein FKW44_021613 [Caligus rogercresseyi]
MPACLGIYDVDNSGYADDTCIWAVANDLTTIGRLLTETSRSVLSFCDGEWSQNERLQDAAPHWWYCQGF